MSDTVCSCGAEAVHLHELDGKPLRLCGYCHAVLHLVKNNHMGMPAHRAVVLLEKEEDSYFDRFAASAPTRYEPVQTLKTPQPEPSKFESVDDPLVDDDEPVFYRVIPDSFGMVTRRPPVLEETIT